MSKLTKEDTCIDGVFVINKNTLRDERGFFERVYCKNEMIKFGLEKNLEQINISNTSRKGVVRGMHIQAKPHEETKIVTCLTGCVFDVAVDLRKNSPSYLHCFTTILSEENRRSMVIPQGCAHGFQTLTNDCQLLYFHSASYTPEAEYGVNSLDTTLNINWPLDITYRSKKDANLPFI